MSLVAIVAEPRPDGCVPDLFVLADEVKRHDWYVQPQLSYGGSPANIHLTATATSGDRVDALPPFGCRRRRVRPDLHPDEAACNGPGFAVVLSCGAIRAHDDLGRTSP